MSSSEKGDGGCWCKVCPSAALPCPWEAGFSSRGQGSRCHQDAFSPWGPVWASHPRPGSCCGLRGSLRALGAPFPASAPSVGVRCRCPERSPYLGDRAPSGERLPSSLLGRVLPNTGDAARPTGHGCARSVPVEAQSPHATCRAAGVGTLGLAARGVPRRRGEGRGGRRRSGRSRACV